MKLSKPYTKKGEFFCMDIIFKPKQSGFPGGSDGKASVYNAEDPGLSPGLGRSPGEGNSNPLQYYSGEGNGNLLQYSCLENAMEGGAW